MRHLLVLIGVTLLSARVASAQPMWFVVGEKEPFHNDSYLVPLTDPADIAHARDLIARGPDLAGSPIVVAKIARGADGLNGDYIEPDLRLWNWRVTEFEGFADFTVEILDGWPTFVESDIDRWIANTNGTVGFWNYTIVGEFVVPEPGILGVSIMGSLVLLRRR